MQNFLQRELKTNLKNCIVKNQIFKIDKPKALHILKLKTLKIRVFNNLNRVLNNLNVEKFFQKSTKNVLKLHQALKKFILFKIKYATFFCLSFKPSKITTKKLLPKAGRSP